MYTVQCTLKVLGTQVLSLTFSLYRLNMEKEEKANAIIFIGSLVCKHGLGGEGGGGGTRNLSKG